MKSIPKISADSANAFSFYDVFCPIGYYIVCLKSTLENRNDKYSHISSKVSQSRT